MTLTFAEIEKASPLPIGPQTMTVAVPHWGGNVTLRKMTAAEHITMATRLHSPATGSLDSESAIGAGLLYLVVCTAVDDDGNQLFTGDKVKVLNRDSKALAILGTAALSFNSLDSEASAPGNEPSTPQPNSA
jgi:hypothetical protein